MVVFGVAISNMSTQSLVSVFGLLFLQRLADLHISTKGASMMMAVQTTCTNLCGIIIGPVIKRFSYRKTAMAGAAFVVSGLLFTLIANSLPVFLVTYSFLTGVGLGLLNPSTFVAVDSYFSTRKGRAVGLALAGTGIGQMCLPLLIEFLLRRFEFHGTILILSGIAMHALVGATLYQPVKWHLKPQSKGENGDTTSEEDYRTSQSSIECSEEVKSEPEPKAEKEEKKEEEEEEKNKVKKKNFLARCCAAINIELLKNPSFVILLIDLALVYVANMCFSMLLPFFLESIEFSRPNIAFCMSMLAGADILGRLIIPIFTDLFKVRSTTTFFVGALMSALARSALAWQQSFLGAILFAAVCGFVRAGVVMNFNMSISEEVPTEKLPSALGLHMLFKGAGIMIFGYIVGFIRDYTQSFSLCIHILSGFFLGVPFCIWLIEWLYKKYRK